MRWFFVALTVVGGLAWSATTAPAQGTWGRGPTGGIQPPWNNHSRLQKLGNSYGPEATPQAPSSSADVSPRGLARSLLWPFGSSKPTPQQAPPLPTQPWPAQGIPSGSFHPQAGLPQASHLPGNPYAAPSAQGALPGAVQPFSQVPPTAYQMPTSVYHQWTPQQVNPALYQRATPAPPGPGVTPAQATQPFPQANRPAPNPYGQVPPTAPSTVQQSLPGRSIQPQVVGTIDRRELNKPSWLQRLQSLWPFGRR